jgi:hypothetical protein
VGKKNTQRNLEKEMIRAPIKVSTAFRIIPSQIRVSYDRLVHNITSELHKIDDAEAFSGLVVNDNLIALVSNAILTVVHNKIIPQLALSQDL